MKSHFYVLATLFILFISCKENKLTTNSIDIPINTNESVVYDTSNLFSFSQSDSLTQKIIHFEEKTTNQIAVLTVDSIPKDIDILHFSNKVADSWGIGTKEKDNGLLITISKYNKKLAISTGLGTEKTISDYQCKVIIDSIIIPNFKKENYYKGIDRALDSLIILWD